MNEPSNQPTVLRADGRYLATIGILLVLIIGLLAALWVRERRRRRRTEGQYASLRAQHDGLRGTLGQLLGTGGGRPGPSVRRDDLPTETVTINGRERLALRISAAAGRRFGFRPGDIVLVSEPPPPPGTSPATQPAGVPPPSGGP